MPGQWTTGVNAVGAAVGYGGGIALAYAGATMLSRVPFHPSGSDDGGLPVVGIVFAVTSFYLLSLGGWFLDRAGRRQHEPSGA